MVLIALTWQAQTVPRVTKVTKTIIISDFVESKSFEKPNGPDSFIHREREHYHSGVGYYRNQLHQKGISEQATTLVSLFSHFIKF